MTARAQQPNPDRLDHYLDQARLALYPEIVECLRELIEAGDDTVRGDDDVAALLRFGNADKAARALLSRLPAERDKGAG